MKYVVYARPPSFWGWLIIGWYIVSIVHSEEEAALLVECGTGENCMLALEMPLPLPIKFRFLPKGSRIIRRKAVVT